MNISIVDDKLLYCKQLETQLKQWGIKNNITLNIFFYDDESKLFSQDFLQNDLIFLDINIPVTNGIDIAIKLRQRNYNGYIIFHTSYKDYAYESYQVQAFDYLLKPVSKEKLTSCLDSILNELQSSAYILKTSSSMEKNTLLYYNIYIRTRTLYKYRNT